MIMSSVTFAPMTTPSGSNKCVVNQAAIALREYYISLFAKDDKTRAAASEYHRLSDVTTALEYVMAILCILGVLGNILNILVLSRKGLLVSMERMERSAHFGLLALAVSDLLFCSLALPRLWVENQRQYPKRSFSLYYATYSDGFINTFLLSSTWLTVTMATSRYLAICFPLRARQVIGMTFAKISIAVVFLTCILFNIPKYFSHTIEEKFDELKCETRYTKEEGPLLSNKVFAAAYRWSYFVLGMLIPLLVLAYCNINLVRALQHSVRMQASLRATRTRTVHTTNRITLIFIIIIILYLLMVLPGELVHFARDLAAESGQGHFHYNLVIAITNTCQTFNFSVNFVLYLIVNTHFRSQLCQLVQCICCRASKKKRPGHSINHLGSAHTPSTSYSRQMEMSTTEQLLDSTTVGNGRAMSSSFMQLADSHSSLTHIPMTTNLATSNKAEAHQYNKL